MGTNEEKKTFLLGGLPWWQAAAAIVLCLITMFWGIQSSSHYRNLMFLLCFSWCFI